MTFGREDTFPLLTCVSRKQQKACDSDRLIQQDFDYNRNTVKTGFFFPNENSMKTHK